MFRNPVKTGQNEPFVVSQLDKKPGRSSPAERPGNQRPTTPAAALSPRCHHCGELCTQTVRVPLPPHFDGAADSTPSQAAADGSVTNDNLIFCCTGCVAAWHILQGRELPDFVHAAGRADQDADPELLAFDLPEIAREYLSPRGEGSRENGSRSERGDDGEMQILRLELDVRGIHCQSCITVCERSLERLPEVERAVVDYETGRARVDIRAPRSPDDTRPVSPANASWTGDAAKRTPGFISRAIRQLRLVGYDGVPLKPGGKTEALRDEGRSLLWKLVLSGFAAGNTMMLSIALWSGYFDGSLPVEYKRLFEWMQFVLTTPVFLYTAQVFHRGWRGFFRTGAVGMDVLISSGISAAYFYSVFVFLWPLLFAPGQTLEELGALAPGLPTAEVYFDSVAMIVFLLLVGRYLEWRARLRQRERMESLLRPLPDFCFRLKSSAAVDAAIDARHLNSNAERDDELIPVSELQTGDRVLLRVGESVPADGVLLGPAACELDESVLTGEARPVLRRPGDRVLAGSRLLLAGDASHSMQAASAEASEESVPENRLMGVLRVTAPPRESSLGILANMTAGTGGRRQSRIERSTGRLVPWFGFGVLAIAAGSFTYFYGIAGAGLETALLAAVSVLIVSCPCALALSVPTAAGAALFMGLREGVLFRDGRVLEELDTIRDFRFDKTGTLTGGRPRVIASRFYTADDRSTDPSEILEMIRTLESGTMHPIGLALLEFARTAQANLAGSPDRPDADDARPEFHESARLLRAAADPAERVQNVAGRGLYDAHTDTRLGSLAFLGLSAERESLERELGASSENSTENSTLVGLTRENRLLAVFALSDSARSDARATLDFLRARNCSLSILTGDQEQPALRLAREVGVAPENVYANLLPAEKTALIRQAPGRVAMVGDGFNDAPALAAADLSIVHALSAPLSLEQAGIVLLNNRLSELQSAVRIAGAARRVMRANLGFSLLYNAVMIPLAAMGLLLPIWCALFMALSSLTVIGSSALFRLSFRVGPKNQIKVPGGN